MKNSIEEILKIQPYSLSKEEKTKILTEYLLSLTLLHKEKCSEYASILDASGFDANKVESYYDLPFLPVRLFKEYSLASVSKEEIAKTMTSSGTTGQQVSQIYLDRETSILQTKALTKLVSNYIGNKRMPMVILDTSAVVKNRDMFSARGAGIRGFSMFGRDVIYALNENMELNYEEIKQFLIKHEGENIFLYGFTFMIWQHFCMELKNKGLSLDLSKGILIHGGGWKKLLGVNISSKQFKQELFNVCKITRVYDYYGMVEQSGSIYIECECGHLHASNLSDIIIRRTQDFSVANIGEIGLIEVVSILPHSYPGHVLLTEDEGVILGEDDCPCGRMGKYFKINGRIANAEIRGCSDTYAAKF